MLYSWPFFHQQTAVARADKTVDTSSSHAHVMAEYSSVDV